MPPEPLLKRAAVFVDGQNLFHAAKAAFGRTHPDYDVAALAQALCLRYGWTLSRTRFYTGVPDGREDPGGYRYWSAKLLQFSRERIDVFSRPLRYRAMRVSLSDGTRRLLRVGEEKGIDVRIAIDVVRGAYHGTYDVAILFSQDQDLSEVAVEIREIAREQKRWIKIASAYPMSPTSRDRRGIDKTDWIPIDRTTYEACVDPRDYRG